MRSIKASIAVLVFLTIACCVAGFAQQFKSAPLTVQRSAFIDQLKALRAADPKMPPSEFAAAANTLLDKHGIGFAVLLDATTCEKVRKAKEQTKDPSAIVTLGATLRSVDAEGASLTLPAPTVPSGDCGCYIELPILQMTEKDFITVISGRNIRFHKPSFFSAHEALLIEPADHNKVKLRWLIPFRGVPIGVSHDENVLYLAFPGPELADLSFLVFGEGVFQIGTRAEADEGGKGKHLNNTNSAAVDKKVQFDRWGKSLLVSYRLPCK